MAEVSIEVKILGREYPLKVNEEDEALIQDAVLLVERKLKQIRDRFSVRDEIDPPTMTALQYAVVSLVYKRELEQAKALYPDLEALLTRIDQEISKFSRDSE